MLIPVLIGVFTIAFILNQMMPGDPARQLVGETATEEAYQSMREQLGLNRPLIQQYFDYLKNLVIHGDLGTSYTTKQPVMTEILGRMPTTLILAGLSVLSLSAMVSLPKSATCPQFPETMRNVWMQSTAMSCPV